MEKVKISKEVAKAIENAKEMYANDYDIMHRRMSCTIQFGLEEVDWFIIARALQEGYEIEQTPEDTVRDYYNAHLQTDLSVDQYTRKAIVVTLNLLNIKIEGVND